MFDKVIDEMKDKIPGYECIMDVLIENPYVSPFPFYDREKPVFRLIGSRQPLVFIIMANKRFEKTGWRQVGGSDTYDYYKVVVEDHAIKTIEKIRDD